MKLEHDLRNKFLSLQFSLDLAQNSRLSEDTRCECLQKAQKAKVEIETLVQQLTDPRHKS